MTFGPLEWAVVSGIVIAICSLLGVSWRLQDRISKTEHAAANAAGKAEGVVAACDRLVARTASVEAALADHKERVARDYVPHESLIRFEERVVNAIAGLGDRIDKLVGQILLSGRREVT